MGWNFHKNTFNYMEAGKEKVHALPGKDLFSPFQNNEFFTENNRMRFHREMIIDVRKFDYKFYLIVAKIPGAYHIEMG